MEIKRKLIPFTSAEVPEIEEWLCENARKGLFYKDSGLLFVNFEVAEPKNRRYRLEYKKSTGTRDVEKLREMYEDCGWTACGDLNNKLLVVYTDDEDAPDNYSTPEELIEPFEALAKTERRLGILFLTIFFFMPIAEIFNALFGLSEFFISHLLKVGTGLYIATLIVSMLVICEAVFHFFHSTRLKKRIEILKETNRIERNKKAGKAFSAILANLSTPLLIVAVLLSFFVLRMGGTNWDYSADSSRETPFLSLTDITDYELASNEVWQTYAGFSDDLLAPDMILFSQSVYNHNNDDWQPFGYTVQYVEFRSLELAKQFEEEQIQQMTGPDTSNSWNAIYKRLLRDEGTEAANDFLLGQISNYTVTEKSIGGAELTLFYEPDSKLSTYNHEYRTMIIRYENKVERISLASDRTMDINLFDYAEEYVKLLKK